MGGGRGAYCPPPFSKAKQSKTNLKCQKSEKNSIPLFRSLLCTLCFNFYQNHLVCLQNAFEKTYPKSRSPKVSCHILCWLDVYILQNNITPGRLCFGPCACKKIQDRILACEGGGVRKREREREVLAVQCSTAGRGGDRAGNYQLLCGSSSWCSLALSASYNVCGMEHSD